MNVHATIRPFIECANVKIVTPLQISYAQKVLAKAAGDELALPHLTAEVSKRSIYDDLEAANSKRSIHHEYDLQDEISKPDNSKTNLFVENLKTWRPSRWINAEAESEDEESGTLYSPKSCSICLEPYREGDDICWSQNEKCAHVYHLDCIVDWLMNSNECPLCRADYLKEEDSSGSLSC